MGKPEGQCTHNARDGTGTVRLHTHGQTHKLGCHSSRLHGHIRLCRETKSWLPREEVWKNFGCAAQRDVPMQPRQCAVRICSRLARCAAVYRFHLCGPDNAASLITLCQKTLLIMGRLSPLAPLLLRTLSLYLSFHLTKSLPLSQVWPETSTQNIAFFVLFFLFLTLIDMISCSCFSAMFFMFLTHCLTVFFQGLKSTLTQAIEFKLLLSPS